MDIKSSVGKLTTNWMGSVAGGLAGYFGASKLGVTNHWGRIGVAIAGVFVGSMIQSKVSAKMSAPKASTVAGK